MGPEALASFRFVVDHDMGRISSKPRRHRRAGPVSAGAPGCPESSARPGAPRRASCHCGALATRATVQPAWRAGPGVSSMAAVGRAPGSGRAEARARALARWAPSPAERRPRQQRAKVRYQAPGRRRVRRAAPRALQARLAHRDRVRRQPTAQMVEVVDGRHGRQPVGTGLGRGARHDAREGTGERSLRRRLGRDPRRERAGYSKPGVRSRPRSSTYRCPSESRCKNRRARRRRLQRVHDNGKRGRAERRSWRAAIRLPASSPRAAERAEALQRAHAMRYRSSLRRAPARPRSCGSTQRQSSSCTFSTGASPSKNTSGSPGTSRAASA